MRCATPLQACRLGGLLFLGLSLLAPAPRGQEWSVEELRDRCEGFHEPGVLPGLTQIAELVAVQDDAFAAICVTIQGDHREYQLRIQKLLDQLADDRWLAREDAERTLVEVGGRAMVQIQERSETGVTLEERVRAARVLESIAARGTEAEEAEIRLLRGLALAAGYMRPDPRLTRALSSAMDHSDPWVREHAARGLGRAADAELAPRLAALVAATSPGDALRLAALTGLVRLAGAPALDATEELLTTPGALPVTEAASVLRELVRRPDAGPVLGRLAEGEGLLGEMARTAMAASVDGRARLAWFDLAADSPLEARFLGMGAYGVEVADPVPGLERAELGPGDCNVVNFDADAEGELPARVFLLQGTLLGGELLSVDEDVIRLESSVFDAVEIPRALVQGLAVDPDLDRMVGASSQHDRLRLREGGDLVDGRFLGAADGRARMETVDGEVVDYPLADVAGVLFRRPVQITHDPELYTRIDLSSGDRLLAHVVAAGPGALAVVVPGVGGATVEVDRFTRIETGIGGGAVWGFTLIADYSENRVIEVDDQGREVFALEEVYGAWDAECLDNGNLLITEFALNRVVEVTREGDEVWSFDKLRNPYDADRLPNGNTLIADTFGDRVIEVSPEGEIVWKLEGLVKKPYDVDRLPNGNTLIADGRNERVVEVDPSGQIVWSVDGLENVHDADRLPNGNTLITQRTKHRVIEVDRNGNTVFEIPDLSSPSDADRLPNGNTLIAENGWVREFDRRGRLIWEREVAWAVEVNRY